MMNDLTISAIMQDKNNRRFQELLSEVALERRYRQQTSHRPTLRQWVADHLIAVSKQLKARERQAIKPTCACVEMT